MSNQLEKFASCVTAVHQHITNSTADDREAALAASAALVTVNEQIQASAKGEATEEEFKELLDQHVVTVLESIEQIRSSSAYEGIDETLSELLDSFYDLADLLMGGGGGGPYPPIGGSSFTSFTS